MEYVFTFLEGVASFISPCLLPMLPIYISYFIGEEESNKNKKIINSIGFVLGFTIIFMILSVFASSLGKLISESIKYIKIIFGIIIILLGLNYIDIIKLKFLNKSKFQKTNTKNLNFIKSFIFGVVFSISWTPCIGTFLSAALLMAIKSQDVLKGILLMFIYSIGLGVPFILSVILMEYLKNVFNFIKKNYGLIKKISGAILILLGIYMIFF